MNNGMKLVTFNVSGSVKLCIKSEAELVEAIALVFSILRERHDVACDGKTVDHPMRLGYLGSCACCNWAGESDKQFKNGLTYRQAARRVYEFLCREYEAYKVRSRQQACIIDLDDELVLKYRTPIKVWLN